MGQAQRAACGLSSVKSNVGHLEAASGMAGLFKAIGAVAHAQLPATLHLETPNRHLTLESSPFYLNDRLRPWPASPHPRRAGVSSFGRAAPTRRRDRTTAPGGR